MAAALAQTSIPLYRLQHLISNVSELLRGHSDRGPVEVRCAQALGSEIYVGCSDGSLLRYAFVDSLESSAESYQLLTHQSLPSGWSIDEIVLAPNVEKALVFCGRQIHFFKLPNLEPVEGINPLRRVVAFALDEAQQRRPAPDARNPRHSTEQVNLCVVKANSISVYTLGVTRLGFRKEMPLPSGATVARLSGQHLCMADHEMYHTIDLETSTMIPLLPISQAVGPRPDAIKPSITVIGDSEFLILSWNGSSTLGVFIMGTGDPVRGTLEWGMHPVALCCDYPHVTSLLPNGSTEVHNVESQSICQVIPPLQSFSPLALEKSFVGYVVPSGDDKDILDNVAFTMVEPDMPDTTAIEDAAVEDARTVPSPRVPPSRHDSLHSSSISISKKRQYSMRPKSTILALGSDAVYSLVTPTLVQQVEKLLESHKLKEAANLVKEYQQKLEQKKRASQSHNLSEIEAQSEEISYVYQRLGYKCLAETIFEDAGINLFRGNVDPRLLIRLFPTLRGTLLSSPSVSLPVFSGLVSQIRSLDSVDTIIVTNLVKNYTPYLEPNTRSAPPTSELRRLLTASARDMLREYLRKWKNKVLYSGEPAVKEVSEAIDTVLVKILAENEDTQELYALLGSSSDIIVEEVEDTLVRTGQYNALLKLYQKQNDEGKMLNIWSKLVDGEWSDDDIHEPLLQMIALLNETRDRALVQKWGLWLVKRDTAAGLKLLMSSESKRSSKTDDSALLAQLQEVSPEAGQQFLEYLILQKRSNDKNLNTRLAQVYFNRLTSALESQDVFDFFKDSTFEYSIQNTSIPFLNHFASIADVSSPMYEYVRTRCQTALFLQGSMVYDVRTIRDKLTPWEGVLGLEVAILDGKLGKHNNALKTLVHTLRDTASADAYCALGGCAISPKVAQFVGGRLELQPWAKLVVGDSRGRNASKVNDSAKLEETRSRLLKVLLEVYMSGGEATEKHTARLLNSQGGNLDVLDVLRLVPPTWSLNVVSSFLARSLRQTVHERCEGEILKAVCLGQNLETRDSAYLLIRSQGAVLEEPVPSTETETPRPTEPMEKGSVDGAEKIVVIAAEGTEQSREKQSRGGVGVNSGVGGEIT